MNGYTYTEKLFDHYHLWDSNVTGCSEFFICQICNLIKSPFAVCENEVCEVKQCGSLLFPPWRGRQARKAGHRPWCWETVPWCCRCISRPPFAGVPPSYWTARTVPSGESWLLSLPWLDTHRLIIRGQTLTVLDFILYSITHPGKPSTLDLQKEGV